MTHKIQIYPHNDLFNLAYYQREIINKKIKDGIEEALGLDCMSCLISLAFTTEALVNFVGKKRVPNWNEGKRYLEKIKYVCAQADVTFSKHREPYKTLWELKTLRDSMAHGKPVEFQTDIENRNDFRKAMECSWDKNLTPDYVNSAYDQVKIFERLLIVNCNISVGETITSAIALPA